MSFKAGSITGAIELSIAPLKTAFASARAETNKFASGFRASLDGLRNGVAGVAAQMTALAGGVGVVGAAIKGVKLAADFEQTTIAFETMLGSAKAASDTLEKLKSFAASTPFEFPELAGSAKMLLAFGEGADSVVSRLRMLGDISSGVGVPINDMAQLFGKARVQGTLMAEDINQLVGRGIPVIQEFAKQFGVSESEIKKLASQGKISFANLDQAFRSLTSEGGRFYNLTARQSQSLGGLFSTMKDSVSESLRKVGESLVRELDLKGVVSNATAQIERFGQAIVPVVAAAARWASAHKELILSLAGVTAGAGAALAILPRLASTASAVGSAFNLAGSAMQLAFANPLLAVGVVAVGAFTAVLARSIAMNESWTESAYQMSRAIGLFRSPIQDMGAAIEALGQNTQDLADVQRSLGKADIGAGLAESIEQATAGSRRAMQDLAKLTTDKNLGPEIDLLQKELALLDDRSNILAKQIDLRRKAGQDVSVEVRAFGAADQKVTNLKQIIESLRNADIARQARAMMPPPIELPSIDAKGVKGAKDGIFSSLAGNALGMLNGVRENIDKQVNAFRESIKTPEQKFDEAVQQLKQWRNANLISAEDFDAGIVKAKKELDASQDKTKKGKAAAAVENRFADLITRGSAEEIKLRFGSSEAGSGLQVAKEQLQEQKKMREALVNINRSAVVLRNLEIG